MAQKRPLPVGLILFFCFIVVPASELMILIWLARVTNIPFTLGVILVSALAGASLVRWQGLSVLRDLQQQQAAGRFPADSLLDGVMILAAGALMLTPGLLTDVFGFSILLPFTRRYYREGIKRAFRGSVQIRFGAMGPGGGGFPPPGSGQSPPAEDQLGESGEEDHPFHDDSPFERLKK